MAARKRLRHRFFRDQGPDWCRGVEIVVSDGSRSYHPDHRPVPARRPPRLGPLSRGAVVHRRLDPGSAGTATPRPRGAAPNVRAGPASEPGSLSCGGRIISQKGTRSIWIACSRLTPGSAPRGRLSRSCASSCEADDLDGANQALGRFADLYAAGQTPRIPPSRGHHHRLGRRNPGLPPQTSNQRTHRRHQQPAPWSYAESVTGSPTQTTSQPEDSS